MSNKIAFGCSHTYGIGVQPDEAWPALLGAVNCGKPGCSTDYIARICEEQIVEHKSTIAYFFWPDWTRFERNDEQFMPATHPHMYKDRTDEWLHDNREDKIVKIENICSKHDVLMVSIYMENLFGVLDHCDRWPLGTDRSHFGPQWHKWLSDIFQVKQSFKEYEKTR